MIVSMLLAAIMVSAASASFLAAGPAVSVLPTVEQSSRHESNGYEYHTVYNHHKEYIYTYTASYCSPPPSSLEVCLSTVFDTIEAKLTVIDSMLKKYEAPLHSAMHHEHTLLKSEVSWVGEVYKIAKSVSYFVDIDYTAIEIQISILEKEKLDVSQQYDQAIVYLHELEAEVNEVIDEVHVVKSKEEAVKIKKWDLYSAISAIVAEKAVVVQEQEQIGIVMEKLKVEISEINEKIYQLYKRGEWLDNWEEKLSLYIHNLQTDIKEFREEEDDLYYRQLSLYKEQKSLLVKIDDAQSCVESLKIEYSKIVEEIEEIYVYEKELREVYKSVYSAAEAFTYAYSDFTCEDDLLYYEACSSKVAAAAPPAAAAKP